jgi:hypothetical protein
MSTSTQEAPPSPAAVGKPLTFPYPKSGPPPPGLALRPLPASPHRAPKGEESPASPSGQKAEMGRASPSWLGRAIVDAARFRNDFL